MPTLNVFGLSLPDFLSLQLHTGVWRLARSCAKTWKKYQVSMEMRKFIRGLMSFPELALDVQGWHVGIWGGNFENI